MTVFGIQPWEREACRRLPSAAERSRYRAWIDVADQAWGLSAADAAEAAAYVDGYLWFGRPWLYHQADGWDSKRALTLARTTSYPGP